MIPKHEFDALRGWFASRGLDVVGTNGRTGSGVPKLARKALSAASEMNKRRSIKGLLPREVRAAVVGFPNVGKSAIINRLVGRRALASANTPGVTRQLRWVKAGEGLYLLDSPGVLPPRIEDQIAAQNLAICNDIGKASYLESAVAAVLVDRIRELPRAEEIEANLLTRYGIDAREGTGEIFVHSLAEKLFHGQLETAGARLLKDYGKGAMGKFALELP